MTPLIYTSWFRSCSLETVSFLVNLGANIEARDDSGSTPLIRASQFGKVEIVALLLNRGANTEARTTKTQSTPLLLASEQNQIEVMSLLLEHGADVETMDIFGNTSLMVVKSRFKSPETITLLSKYLTWKNRKDFLIFLFQNDKNSNTNIQSRTLVMNPVNIVLHLEEMKTCKVGAT